MDSLGDQCPERNGCISSMLFTWMNPLLELGNRRPLETEDLFQLESSLRAESSSHRFQRCWEEELLKKSPSLVRALFYAFGKKYLAAGLLRLVRDSLQFIGPFVIQQVISFLLTPDAPLLHGLRYVALIFIGGILQSFCFRNYMYFVFETGLLIRSAIVCAVYRKSLVLSSSARRNHSAGEITNLMSIDAQRLQDLMADLHAIWYGPFLLTVSCILLYWQVGVATFAGLALILLVIPVTLFISQSMRKFQKSLMEVKDQRIKVCYEVLSGIKVIKLQAWENQFIARVLGYRMDELQKLRSYLLARTASTSLFNGVPSMVTVATFTTYVLLGNVMNTTTALTSLSIFTIMRYPLFVLPSVINAIIEASVSFQRLQTFLLEEELTAVGSGNLSTIGIAVERATLSWAARSEAQASQDEKNDALRNLTLRVLNKGQCAVVGTVGSGKSTLLAGLLGDATCVEGTVHVRGSIAYVAQQPFIQNATVRDNICFGLKYEYGRYQAALHVCCLEDDMKILPAGDLTEIGEKGINLSGGQRTRIALARAVYQDADIYLLDDILAAVDANVGGTIFRECVKGMLANKLVVLVTNNLQVLPQCDSIIVLQQGDVVEHDSYTNLISYPNGFLANMVANFKSADEPVRDTLEIEEDFGTTPGHQLRRVPSSEILEKNGTLIIDEDRSIGDVPWRIYKTWIHSCGGPLVAFLVLALFGFTQGLNISATLWLSTWANNDQSLSPKEHSIALYIFICLNMGFAVLIYIRVLTLYIAGLSGSRKMFDLLLRQILRAPMTFFDTTPLGRIVNRLSKDMYAMDEDIPSTWANVLTTLFSVSATLSTICFVTPWFAAALVPLIAFYYSSQRYFIKTSRELQRLDSISRSPIYALTSETLDGIATIRAYRVENSFQQRNMKLLDRNQRAYYLNFSANCWLGLRLEFSGSMVASFATLFAVLNHGYSTPAFAGLVGVSLSYAFSVTPALNMSVRYLSQLQTQMVSVERIQMYTGMPTEKELRCGDIPPDWPSKGEITFDGVDLRYRLGLPRVLRQLTCTIRGKEKIGVVGRTGAGKSSLVAALMRLTEIHGGRILIDGIDIGKIGLHDLREQISIIPQDPVLFSGTIRSNVDPFQRYTDDALWSAIQQVQIDIASLDDTIEERGLNFSVGERQLLCIARALLKRSKIIVMDEATASIDPDTDRLIQRSIRQVFADCTCITIAHRLHTIMDSDRILVMDRGSAVEFDTPKQLLRQKSGIFSTLVANSRDH